MRRNFTSLSVAYGSPTLVCESAAPRLQKRARRIYLPKLYFVYRDGSPLRARSGLTFRFEKLNFRRRTSNICHFKAENIIRLRLIGKITTSIRCRGSCRAIVRYKNRAEFFPTVPFHVNSAIPKYTSYIWRNLFAFSINSWFKNVSTPLRALHLHSLVVDRRCARVYYDILR